jgi:2-polyprenyl-3-methyl-5-hydroxy-6-metoxy-1,4-benzoquinol methylase
MQTRSSEKELIDLGPSYYTLEEYTDCLKKLGSIGRILGGNRASLAHFNKLKKTPTSILDVGCGGGDFTRVLAKKYKSAQIVGIDFSAPAITYAKKHLDNTKYPNISFLVPDTLELNYPANCFDVVTATLVCHHMTDSELIEFLKKSVQVAKKAVILNDLHRHPVAYYSYFFLAPKLFKNRLITHDGLISIKRGFKKNEWVSLLKEAHIPPSKYSITWEFPFRWIVTITR